MSLVERALKKLQEQRAQGGVQGMPQPAAPVSRDTGPRTEPVRRPSAPVAPAPPAAEKKPWNPTGRVIAIDREALRTLELLPPLKLERLIASQYQAIKRPLVASATGKSGTPMPDGNRIMVASALPGEGKTFTSVNL